MLVANQGGVFVTFKISTLLQNHRQKIFNRGA